MKSPSPSQARSAEPEPDPDPNHRAQPDLVPDARARTSNDQGLESTRRFGLGLEVRYGFAVVVALCACRREPVASCADGLQGIWDGSDRSWSILDDGTNIEIDPLFADAPGDAAPRVMDLERSGDGLVGVEHRLYSRRADHCDAKLPVRIASCKDDTIEIVMTEPSPPIAWSPCAWPRPEPSRALRWRRR